MKNTIPLKELDERIKAVANDEQTSDAVRELLLLQGQIIQGLCAQVETLKAERDALKKRLYGKRSEKSSKPKKPKKTTDGQSKRKPRDPHRETLSRTALPEEIVEHAAPESCPKCGGHELKDLNTPEEQVIYELRPARLVKVKHKLQKCACAQGCTVVQAPPPERVGQGLTRFAPSVYAHIMSARVFDAIPLSRLADRFSRMGFPLRRSTITDLFHRGSEELRGLYEALKERIKSSPLLHADETPQPIFSEGGCKRGFMWTFATQKLALFLFSQGRSGDVPKGLLEGTFGHLVVDGYAGYNALIEEMLRQRVGCLAHLRRKFVEARTDAPQLCDRIVAKIKAIYRGESKLRAQGLLGSEAHQGFRETKALSFMMSLRELALETPGVLLKSKLGKAITYLKNQWVALTRFTTDCSLPLDNNHAERLLRRIALSRKSSLFMSEGRGDLYAITLSLVQSCRLCQISPEAYLSDVLIRVQNTPISRVQELLPDRWHPPDGSPPPVWC
jgi:transposase